MNTPPSPPRSSWHEALDFARSVIIIIALVFLIRGSVIEPFKIPSGSMIPTLEIGDHLLVSKLSYGFWLPYLSESLVQFSSPLRGNIVVFTRPDDPETAEDESEINIIKRVIGLPGDTVEVRGTTVFINGSPLAENDYARWTEGGHPDGNFNARKVPEGHIFLMGDNRDHSKDSRFWNNPFLPISRVKGRALIIYFSLADFWRAGKIIR